MASSMADLQQRMDVLFDALRSPNAGMPTEATVLLTRLAQELFFAFAEQKKLLDLLRSQVQFHGESLATVEERLMSTPPHSCQTHQTQPPPSEQAQLVGFVGPGQCHTQVHVPKEIFVTCPASQRSAGSYELVDGETANGFPLWKLRAAAFGGCWMPPDQRWLFSGVCGRWLIGDGAEYEQGFARDTGMIATMSTHNGAMPNDLGFGDWQMFDGREWRQELEINVTEVFSTQTQVSNGFVRRQGGGGSASGCACSGAGGCGGFEACPYLTLDCRDDGAMRWMF
eukprot:TRINITY_DN45918_c0_g1_i1.p1 TRINITY_DN45918_c0_g1~~TRINITY_DN45918_c0_g1_i1.p1  ORF type:complete len:283 (+),score=50.08 TRINITY_DN45918_c0_g1_i1:43-891(+)